MVPIRQPKVAVQHPFWGDVSTPTPGAAGTALTALCGAIPKLLAPTWSHPAGVTTACHAKGASRKCTAKTTDFFDVPLHLPILFLPW